MSTANASRPMDATAPPPLAVQRRTVRTVSLATVLAMVVYTAPLSIVPTIAAGLHASAAAQSWILSSMSLGFAVALLTCGAVGDDFGRRRAFTAGCALLVLASVLCALAPNSLAFVLGRVLEGVGAAAILACGLGLVGHAFPDGPGRAHATGLWGASVGAGVAIGPILGPLLMLAWSWRVLYWVIAALSLALAVAGRVALTESTSGRGRDIDLPGVALLAAGLASLLAGLTQGRQGWTKPFELALLAAGVLLVAGFLLRQRVARAPMLDLTLFRRPALLAATAAALATGAGVTALMSLVPTLLQRGFGQGALASALVLLGWSATSSVAAVGARHLSGRMSGTARFAVGLVVVAAGLAGLSWLTPVSGDWRLIGGLVVSGLGTGLLNATLGREAVAGVPANQAGMGSGINNTSRYVGAAFGVTIVSVLATSSGGIVAGWNVAALVTAGLSVLGAVAVLACRTSVRRER